MVAVPGVEVDTVRLICDDCGGEVDAAVAGSVRDPDVVWPLTAEHGWAGSPFASGPHRCPGCAVAPGRVFAERDDDRPSSPPPVPRAGRIGVEELRDAVVITLNGDVDAWVTDSLSASLTSAVASGRHVVLDLARVHLIDSQALGLLVRAHREAKHRGTVVCLAAPSRFIVVVLRTMRLHTVFPTFDDRQRALAGLRRRATGAAAQQGGAR